MRVAIQGPKCASTKARTSRLHGSCQAACARLCARPTIEGNSSNCGYHVMTAALWQAARMINPGVAPESQPLVRLAVASELATYEHKDA